MSELKDRMRGRGDTGQIQRAEALQAQITVIKQDLNGLKLGLSAIMDNLGVEVPTAMKIER